jgi:hypothetical protein
LPLHGSCFELYFEKAFCGESGAGNHLLPHLCQDGAQFINDDITPVEITAAATTIIPIKKPRIKLWEDSLRKNLKIGGCASIK